MLRNDIDKLIRHYGVKREAIIKVLQTNRVTFGKKLADNSFDAIDKSRLYSLYRGIL